MNVFKYITMATLVLSGVLFLLMGFQFRQMYTDNPTDIPHSLFNIGTFCVALAFVSFGLGVLHFFFYEPNALQTR